MGQVNNSLVSTHVTFVENVYGMVGAIAMVNNMQFSLIHSPGSRRLNTCVFQLNCGGSGSNLLLEPLPHR